MEGCCLYQFRKTANRSNFYDNGDEYVQQSNYTVQEFHSHLYHSKLQNAATTTAHIYTLLDRMFDKKQMIRGGTMWDQTDGCANPYLCSIDYYMMYFLSKSYQVVLDRSVDTPRHRKYVMDGLNDDQKRYPATGLKMRCTPEVDKIYSKIIRVDAMTKKGEVSFSKECKRLMDLCDEVGTNGDKKHAKVEAKSSLKHK